jgi:hypothetical protein
MEIKAISSTTEYPEKNNNKKYEAIKKFANLLTINLIVSLKSICFAIPLIPPPDIPFEQIETETNFLPLIRWIFAALSVAALIYVGLSVAEYKYKLKHKEGFVPLSEEAMKKQRIRRILLVAIPALISLASTLISIFIQ